MLYKIFAGYLIVLAVLVLWRRSETRRRQGFDPARVFLEQNDAHGYVARTNLALCGVMIAVVAADALFGIPPIIRLPRWLQTGLAGTLLALSLGIFAVSLLTLGESWRIGQDPGRTGPLVTRGIYSRIRHPIYAAALLGFLAAFAVAPNAAAAIIAGMASYVFSVLARLEEGFLQKQHGEPYRKYMTSTGRFLPRRLS